MLPLSTDFLTSLTQNLPCEGPGEAGAFAPAPPQAPPAGNTAWGVTWTVAPGEADGRGGGRADRGKKTKRQTPKRVFACASRGCAVSTLPKQASVSAEKPFRESDRRPRSRRRGPSGAWTRTPSPPLHGEGRGASSNGPSPHLAVNLQHVPPLPAQGNIRNAHVKKKNTSNTQTLFLLLTVFQSSSHKVTMKLHRRGLSVCRSTFQ